MPDTLKIAVAGAGLAGAQHITALRRAEGVTLAAVVDPGANGADAARRENTPHFQSLGEMLENTRPDGVVIATPTRLHPEGAAVCAAAGLPMLVEKPIAADTEQAAQMIKAARANNAPLLVGHHRRHNPLVAAARETIASGALGRMTVINAQCWLCKPDDYFDNEWRRQKGAGPLFINAVHDIDLLRHLCGEVESVRAADTRIARSFEAEDSAALLLKFANGALGTMTVSDATVAPWSWELTAHENPAYPFTSESCYFIGGTRGSMSLPDLVLWQNPAARGWWQPITATRPVFDFGGDAIFRQILQFAAVIRGEQQPLVPGEDALRALTIIEAAKQSAKTGETVRLA